MPFVFAVLSFLFCLVFTFDIRCPVKMNVNQLHATVKSCKGNRSPYLLWKLQVYGYVHRCPIALINKLHESI